MPIAPNVTGGQRRDYADGKCDDQRDNVVADAMPPTRNIFWRPSDVVARGATDGGADFDVGDVQGLVALRAAHCNLNALRNRDGLAS